MRINLIRSDFGNTADGESFFDGLLSGLKIPAHLRERVVEVTLVSEVLEIEDENANTFSSVRDLIQRDEFVNSKIAEESFDLLNSTMSHEELMELSGS